MWDKLADFVETTRDRTVGALIDGLSAAKARRDESAFSIALIALSAKMAKADGVATVDEFEAFRDFFDFPAEEARNVRIVYDLAKKDVAGVGHYLNKVAKLYEDDPAVLEDVLDCLFHVAAADGMAHPEELALLDRAAAAFGISAVCLRRIKATHLGLDAGDPFVVLGVPADAGVDAVRAAYRDLARDHHPDALVARGVPASLAKISEHRMAAINAAYEKALAQLKAG